MLNQKISYQIIRSSRRTMSLEIKPDGRIIVRAPLRLSETRIRKFVEEKQEWILKNMEKIRDLQMTSGKHAKIKVADIQRFYPKWLWLVMAVYKPSFADAENIKIAHIVDVQMIVCDVKCVGDILGTEFCWPKEKRSNTKSLFTPYRRLCFPKI